MENSANNANNEQRGPQADEQLAALCRIAREFLLERRRARRWSIGFKISFIALFLLVLLIGYVADDSPGFGGGHSALIDVQGVISSATAANADYIRLGLRRAYEDADTRGIILRINSPGGSPVQAGHINDEIRRLKEEYPDIPVYAVLGDICASGGYYIAAAADYIYADKASLVGSIGVIMAGFGFVNALEKLGIERRVLRAGENKALLDPFSPLREEEAAHVRAVLEDIYRQFKAVVKEGRGERLVADDKIFSGLIWSGEQSVELGLVDGLGGTDYVARELIGAERIVEFTHQDNLLERFAGQVGNAVYHRLLESGYFQFQ